MPAKSKAQQHLMMAAEHGAQFPMAKKVRASMTHEQMHDFAVGSETGKPEHVRKPSYAERVRERADGHPHRNLGRYLHPKKAR
jgi:hypothetical protein